MDFVSFAEQLSRFNLPVFSVNDVVKITRKPRSYCWLFLSRLVLRGKIMRVHRGKYCLKGAEPFEVASNVVFPSYVSFLSALAFHKLTTQIPVEVQVVAARQKKAFEFGGMLITFTKLKKSAMFGFKREGNILVAEPEKAVIDGLYLPEKMPITEAFNAIKQKEMDVKKLEEYAERLGSVVVKKRLGFLLESAGYETMLKPRLNTKLDVLNSVLPKKGRSNAKWRLIINEVLE